MRDRDYDRGDRDFGGDDFGGGFGGLRGGRTPGRHRDCDFVDHKDLQALRRATTPQGKISNRKRTNSCAKCQRLTAQAVKRARFMGIVGFTS